MIASWLAAALAFFASAMLSEELAKKKHRDAIIYFFIGLVLGPLALLVVITPLPEERVSGGPAPEKELRVVERKRCPECGREVAALARDCPYCTASLETPWWEKVDQRL